MAEPEHVAPFLVILSQHMPKARRGDVVCSCGGPLYMGHVANLLASRAAAMLTDAKREGVAEVKARVEAVLADTPCVVLFADKRRTCGQCVLCQIRAALDPNGGK